MASPNNAASDNKSIAAWTAALVASAESFGQRLVDDAATSADRVRARAVEQTYALLFEVLRSDASATSVNDDEHQFHHAAKAYPLTPQLLAASYERLLDYAPVVEQGRFRLQEVTGRRKPTGSYFTPDFLVEHLLQAALAPVLIQRIVSAVFPDGHTALDTAPPLSQWTSQQRMQAEKALLETRVCDPACGPGGFLVAAASLLAERLALLRFPTGEIGNRELSAAYQDVVRHCIYGVDRDCQSVVIARLALWLAAGTPATRITRWAPGLHCGDSLHRPPLGAPGLLLANLSTDSRVLDAFDWEREFPEVFEETVGGFDVVLGNPPFANAIEGGVDEATKKRLSADFPEVTGTADLSYYFLALAHRIAKPEGAVGLLLPRGVLTGRSTRDLRKRLLSERPPCLIYAPQTEDLFPGAQIFVTLLALRRGAVCLGGRDADSPRLDPIHVTDENWWAPLLRDTQEAKSPSPRLGDAFEVFASMTTGMAYDLLPFVRDEPHKGSLRFITTGLIDPGVCYWGKRKCRYLKKDFERPVIHEVDGLPATLKVRLDRMRRPKVLVGGLSNRVEAFLDRKGEYCGAVSTFTIVSPEDDLEQLARVADFLNGAEATQLLNEQLGAHAMGGGRITLSKDFLRYLPFDPRGPDVPESPSDEGV